MDYQRKKLWLLLLKQRVFLLLQEDLAQVDRVILAQVAHLLNKMKPLEKLLKLHWLMEQHLNKPWLLLLKQGVFLLLQEDLAQVDRVILVQADLADRVILAQVDLVILVQADLADLVDRVILVQADPVILVQVDLVILVQADLLVLVQVVILLEDQVAQ